MSEIEICEKKYPIECNALTYINYRKIFNRGIFEDIKIIKDFITKQTVVTMQIKEKYPDISEEELVKLISNTMIIDVDLYIEAVTRIAYICIYTANPKCGLYENWLQEIERINTNDEWIVEVTEFAVDKFC